MAYTAYLNTVQKIYMGYYQRPADPGGLIHWATQLDAVGGNLNTILPAFANSPEATALYGPINSNTIEGVVNQIYGALFNRPADPGGLAFYVDGFNAGTFTAATIMLNVLNGATGLDLVSVNNKLDAANLFTSTIDPGLNGPPYEANYSDVLDARDTRLDVIDARTWLSGVTSNVGTIPTQAETTAFIKAHIANLGDPILGTAPVAYLAVANVAEDAAVINGSVLATDVDGGVLTFALNIPAPAGLTFNADGTYSFNPANAAYQSLGVGQSAVLTVPFTVTDDTGLTGTANLVITVTGTNDAPIAAAKVGAGLEDNTILVTPSSSDVDSGDTATYSVNSQPANGTVSFNAGTGNFEYIPNANFNGVDSFAYKVTDGAGAVSVATVSLTVTAVNDAPVANNGTADGFEDQPIVGNVVASDVEGDTLNYTVVDQPVDAANPLNPAGTVVMNAATGAFTYTPTPDFNGTATFTFQVNDGALNSNIATVTLTVTPMPEVLTPGLDTILGNDDDDVIQGFNRNLNAGDSINGGGGTDSLILAIDGSNTPLGGPYNYSGFKMDNVENFIVTNDGLDEATFDMSSSENVQTLTSLNSTRDVTFNYANTNAMPGGTFVNLEVINLTKAVNVSLDLRADDVTGSNDQVNLLVTDSDDASYPDVGDINIMQIDTNPDYSSNPSGIEVVNLSTEGSAGNVQISDLNTPGAWNLNIDTDVTLTIGEEGDGLGTVDVPDIERPLNRSVNYVDASGSTGDIALSTERNDTGATILMGSGNDFIVSGDGSDYIEGGQGNDSINAGTGNNNVYGQEGNDWIRTGSGHDYIEGGSGNDNINAGDGNNWVYGEEGNDTIVTGSGNDYIYGGDGNDDITFGAGSDFVYAGAGDDIVRAGANLNSGYTEWYGWWGPGDEVMGGTGTDTLILTGDSGDANELDGVAEFESILLQGGGAYSISVIDNSLFDTDFTTNTTIDATAAGSLMFNGNDGAISGWGSYDDGVLSRAITILGSSGNDTITTGLGADYISGGAGNDIISSGAGNDTVATGTGDDNVDVGPGDDQIIVQGGELTAADTITGGTGNDRITIVNSWGSGYENETANLGINVSGIETIDVDDQDPWNNNDVTVTFEAAYNQAGITVDGSSLDAGERLFVNTAAQDLDGDGVTENFTIIGGAGNDWFNMGNNLGGDSINGGAGWDTLQTEGTIADTAFVGVSSMEILRLTEAGLADNVTLAANAQASGITQVGGTGQADVIDASAYTAGIYVWGAAGDDTITTGSGNDTIYGDGGSDVINSGAGDDIIYIGNNLPGDFVNAGSGDDTVVAYLDQLGYTPGVNDDTLIGGLGNDTVLLSNAYGPVNAGVNLTNVTGFENFTAAYEDAWWVENDVNITFINGNVATLTTINVSGAALTDGLDDLNVDLSGLGDADFAFNITGGAGDDTVTGSNLAENLNFQGGAGNDWMNAPGGDLGTTVSMDGGSGTDTINVTTGKVTDDSFVSISSVEHLTATTALDAQLGAKANAAGIISITGAAGNDIVYIDAAFTSPLSVNLGYGSDMGDDSINAGASASAVTFYGDGNSIDPGDTLIGGSSSGDSLVVTADNAFAELDNVSGIETFTVVEDGDNGIDFYFYDGNFTGVAGGIITLNASALDDTGVDLPEGALTVNAGGITAGAFNIIGGTGNDTIATGSGNDIINAGIGDNSVSGGAGNDSITAGAGNDTIDGGPGSDTIDAGDGNNSVLGGVGSNDSITTGSGNDTIFAGDGADWVSSGGGNDQIAGDVVDAATGGNDTIDAGSGNDTIIGGFGKDSITGGDGADVFMYTKLTDSSGIMAINVDEITDFTSLTDVIDFRYVFIGTPMDGATIDFVGNAINFADAQAGVSPLTPDVQVVFQQDEQVLWVDVDNNGVLDGNDLRIKLTGISTLTGADVLEGSKVGSIVLNSGDSFYGTIANDSVTIADKASNVTVDGGPGIDTIIIGDDVGSVTVLGGADDDTIISGNDSADASTDLVPGTVFTGATVIDGGAGNDTLILDHGDNISSASVTGIETVVLINSTVTMTVDQHNSFTKIIDGLPPTPDTINLTNGGVLIGSPDIETYTAVDLTPYAGEIPANNTTTATAPVGNMVSSQLEAPGDDDWFGTTLQAGHRYQIDLMGTATGHGTLSDPYVYLYNSASTLLASNDDGGTGLNALLVFDAGTTGTYYISARDYNDNDPGSYTLRVTDLGLSADNPASIGQNTGIDISFMDGNAHTVNGSMYADFISGGFGSDLLNGGAGNDTFIGGPGNDTINGGADIDTLLLSNIYAPAADANLVDVEDVTVTGNPTGIVVDLSNQSEGFNVTLSDLGDFVMGGALSNTITGGTGNDFIIGGAAADTITGGLGNDIIEGGTGDDSIDAGAGNDTIVGADNGDIIDGGADTDTLQLSANYTPTADGNLEGVEIVTVTGNLLPVAIDLSNQLGEPFTVFLSNMGDTITTSDGNDTIFGGIGADSITAGSGDDEITGGVGNDTIDGGAGNNTINGGPGNDSITGGANDDLILVNVAGEADSDTIDGVGGTDTLQIAAGANTSLTTDANLNNIDIVTLMGAVSVDLSTQAEAFTINGSTGNDTILGGDGGDTIYGNNGNDSITAGDGNNVITGGLGNDTIISGIGNDTIIGADNNDSIDSGAGTDVLQLSADYSPAADGNLANVENIDASGAPAGIIINLSNQTEGFNSILGSAFNDTITGGVGASTIDGGAGDDIITGGLGADSITGGLGNDTIVGFAGTDSVDGGGGTNTLQMSATSATLDAALNVDLVNIATVDFSSAGAAVSVDLTLQLEAINIIGSANLDTITAATGGGSITGGLGADIIALGAGVDTLAYTAIDESRGVDVDQVTGFTSLIDNINISPITGGSGLFLGNAVDNVSAQMALTGTPGDAVYSIAAATLYVDVNGDALLNNADLAIHLIGVAALNSADITF